MFPESSTTPVAMLNEIVGSFLKAYIAIALATTAAIYAMGIAFVPEITLD